MSREPLVVAVISLILAAELIGAAAQTRAPAAATSWPAAVCDARLTARFAPPAAAQWSDGTAPPTSTAHPTSTYEVCRTTAPLAELRPPAWTIEQQTASEVFVAVHPRVRAALSRLYGGRRLDVARGWVRSAGVIDAITLIAPAPSDDADRVVPGTLIIHTRVRVNADAAAGTPAVEP